MAYNPTRARPPKRKKSRYSGLKNRGIKRSDIVARDGVGAYAPKGEDKQDTKHGFVVPVFTCTRFEQAYECVFSKNLTPMVVNDKGDKTLHILNGVLWVTTADVDKEGVLFDINKREYRPGDTIKIPKGTAHSLATGSVSVEFLITTTAKYDRTSKEVDYEDPIENVPEEAVLMDSEKLRPRRRRPKSESKAMMQAKKMQQQQKQQFLDRNRAASPNGEAHGGRRGDNPNSVASGVNPMPSGPPKED